MSVATLSQVKTKVNKELGQMAKHFSHPSYGGSKTVSSIKQFINYTTTTESVKFSKAILADITMFVKLLPTTNEDIHISSLKSYVIQTNNNIQFVNQIICDIKDNITDNEGKIEVDDKNMKEFIANFFKIEKTILYASDYLNLLLQVYNAKKEIKEGKYIDYTLDELLVKLKAA